MIRPTTFLLPVALGATFLLACGKDSATPDAATGSDAAVSDAAVSDAALGDAAVSDAGPDANLIDAAPLPDGFVPPGSPSCAELAAPVHTLSAFPATYAGDLAGAEANLDISDATHCAESDAPTGQAGAGQDQVIALTGLTPGATYYYELQSGEDLAAYVITGCDTASPGPGFGQCLAYADSQGGGGTEAERFVAPADGKAFVVVDFYTAASAPSPTTYTLTVTTTGVCINEFDCASAATSGCNTTTHTCDVSSTCVGDDTEAEAASDDGPAGATPISLAGAPVTINAHICADSAAATFEADYYKVTVANGAGFTASMAWDGTDTTLDLDLAVFDASGAVMGESFWENPETVQLSFLPAGTYFVRVVRYNPDSTAVTPYALTLTPGATQQCTGVASCAQDFRNQIFRAVCNAQGACTRLAGHGAVPVGGSCDSIDDCTADAALCAAAPFIANADTRAICAKGCTSDTDCTGGFKCTSGFGTDFCVPACSSDAQCPALLGRTPTTPPWFHATCVVAEGRCMAG